MAASAYSLYIIECADGTLYTGVAADVDRRLLEHSSGKRGAKYLRSRGPLTLRFRQTVGDRGRALRVEARVKKLARPKKLAIIESKLSLDELLES